MKHKKLATILSAVFSVILAFSLFGCSLFGGSYADATYPYDVALENGYSGSEAEWLASIDTPSTYERQLYKDALASGTFTGTYFDFLKSLTQGNYDDSAAVNLATSSVVSITATVGGYGNSGTGVIWTLDKNSGNAYIVTNYHVVYVTKARMLANTISLYLYGGEKPAGAISAQFYGGAMDYDIAILKVTDSSILKESSATSITTANSDSVTIGERVYAIGNPNGEGLSVTNGIVSVVSEYIYVERADNAKIISLPEIRTDAPINHGNSGGALVNASGALLGIVNARRETAADGETVINGFGYAIPVNVVSSIVDNIFANNSQNATNAKAKRAKLGITVNVESSKGVYNTQTGKYYIEEKIAISRIDMSGIGNKLNLGDTLISASIRRSGSTVVSMDFVTYTAFVNILFQIRLGDTLVLTVSRNNVSMPIEISFFSTSNFETIE